MKNKIITSLLTSFALLSAGCQQAKEGVPVEEGVSFQLAQQRQSTITDLHYSLCFDIPAQKGQPIEAEETLRFSLDSLWAIQVDWREEAAKLHGLWVNGKETTIDCRNEHIILPASGLKAGENEVKFTFEAGEQSLNRREDYLYTLFVPDRARTAFPCFDQPNLKGRFTLALKVPESWIAVTNTKEQSVTTEDGKSLIRFGETEPLSTYLFAFATGKFEKAIYTDPASGRTIGAYYRETDPQRLAQLPDIFREVCFALQWQEDFTGVKYPFAKYDFVVLPGFQFGGMEHTGATFYNDNTLFLPAEPTLQERLSRSNLIAHETSHMWFGDCVTMQWFNDVWTKEVFANYFAAAITEPLYPTVDHQLNWLRTFQASALSEDRTEGGTAIQQPLDNLKDAGLIYNNIIYNKAPIVMRKMVELMGPEAFQRGIQRYVKQFAYSNATWDDLIDILDSETDEDLKEFSRVWVKEKGMPYYEFSKVDNKDNGSTLSLKDAYEIKNSDRYGRDLYWPQQWRDSITPDGQILPNVDGRGYGVYTFADSTQLYGLLDCWQRQKGVARQSLLMTLNENYLMGRLNVEAWKKALVKGLRQETDPLTAGTLVSYLYEPLLCAPDPAIEKELIALVQTHPLKSVRTQLWRLLAARMSDPSTIESVRKEWAAGNDPLLSVNDYMTMSYELAVRLPQEADSILSQQRRRLTNEDRQRQFDFISRAVVPDVEARDTLFASITHDPQARRIEPWTRSVLYYLNHPVRQQDAVKYIEPALEVLPDVQRTGDIFFPGQWCSNLLAGHRSPASAQAVQHFLATHPDLNPLLRNKILVAAARVSNF